MCPLRITIVPVIERFLRMIKNGTDEHSKISTSSSLYESFFKLHYAELLISFGEYYLCDRKISPKIGSKKHKYIECI